MHSLADPGTCNRGRQTEGECTRVEPVKGSDKTRVQRERLLTVVDSPHPPLLQISTYTRGIEIEYRDVAMIARGEGRLPLDGEK